MAKKTARDNERRARVEALRREQARKERTRSFVILGACIVVVIGLLAAAVVPYVKQQRAAAKAKGTPLADIGPTASAASCEPVRSQTATGNQDHVPVGTKVDYPDSPPAFGKHWGNYLTGSEIRAMYTRQDRPQVERLVHSLEHGYSILWYDDSVLPGTSAYETIQAIAEKLPVGNRFIAAPWTSKDGGAFPSGTHVALTHWTGPQDQQGKTEYCAAPSGAAVASFMKAYPAEDAPEPGAV